MNKLHRSSQTVHAGTRTHSTTFYQRLRLRRARFAASSVRGLAHLHFFASLFARVRAWPVGRQVVNMIADYHRVFPDLLAAKAVVERYPDWGHQSDRNIQNNAVLATKMRPSDYPVIFHLSRIPLEGCRCFDLGGNTGNLFYLYDQYVHFPTSFRWTVCDFPANIRCGQDLARQRGESRLCFTQDRDEASGRDVLLISGALHYLEYSLADFLAGLPAPPKYVLVNRVPLVDAPTAATIQFVGGVMVACRLLNRADLMAEMERIGYRAVDQWSAPELSLPLPFDPEYSVRQYSGLAFQSIF